MQYRCQIGRIGHEPAVVTDVTILPNSRSWRCVVEVIDTTMIQQMPERSCRRFALFRSVTNPCFLMTSPQRRDPWLRIACLMEGKRLFSKNQRITGNVEQPHPVGVCSVLNLKLHFRFQLRRYLGAEVQIGRGPTRRPDMLLKPSAH